MITIRPYTPADQEAIFALLDANTPKYFAPEEKSDLVHYLESQIEYYFVAEFNDQIVGSGGVNFKGTESTGYLSWDFVSPNVQGKGIGTKLVEHRIDFLKQRPNISSIIVRTSQLVYPFYEKCGFKTVNQKKDYWAEGYDLYEMYYAH